MDVDMGYFEAVTSGSFKTTEDGRRLFFPWGTLGRGYVLPSENDYRRHRTQVKAYMVATFAFILVPSLFRAWALGVSLVIALIGFYGFWMWFLLRRLDVADERLSFQESMISQAGAHREGVLWLLTVSSLVLALGGLLVLAKPDERLLGFAAIAFFGLCAAVFIRMLILRYRSDHA
ncbi:hypothetical protein [Bradyrhizobium sp. BR 10261]|uniref:hypothetical protein n=1 Tax=Bradyrhizobium sp. BR 10261 TaxID=2749992 RepID=UPI001C644F0D|nr:hypothetical protein [Bradyrhizobium sp. BR 10261]MBW7967336.1 hypothetical protein [Bradyrhizobium sp. BR 10261]